MGQEELAIADPDIATDRRIPRKDSTSLYESCSGCPKTAHCCYRATTIVVLPEEAKSLIERIGTEDFLRDEANGLFTIVKNPGEACPLLTADGLCSVYDVRPTDCRSWPVTLARESVEDVEYLTDMGCPIAQQGKLDEDFLTSAKQVLGRIDLTVRPSFIELVHRDSLPLVPLSDPKEGERE